MTREIRKGPKPGAIEGVDRLARLMDCFLGFGADPLQNINRLTSACGEMLGGACALYNRLQQGMLCSWGQWKAPPGYKSVDAPDGHICYDVIRRAADDVLVVRNLDETAYALTDPNVRAYNLRTYVGKAVKLEGKSLGSLCVVYQEDFTPDREDEEILGAIAKAIGVEEERALAAEELRKSREILEALVGSAPLAIVTFDSGGVIRMWNPAAERMFGWTEGEVIGKPHPIVPEDKQEEFRALRDIALRGETFTDVEVRRRRKDGTNVDLSISTAPLRAADGSIVSIMSIISDISERKRTEEMLRHREEQFLHAQKMEAVGRLAGGIAHDFNNLLTAVTGYSELLQGRIGSADPMWKELEEIRRAGVRAAALTRQLLTFSRRQVLQVKVLDLNDIIRGLDALLARLIGEDVELAIELCGSPARMKADSGQIEQVIMNLVINAREAMRKGGHLTIRTAVVALDRREASRMDLAEPGSYVMLTVIDTGVGMSDEVKSHIFEPFFTTKEEGTGLGLATVYGIVRHGGGGIRVASHPGKGTTIDVCFPRAEAPSEVAQPEAAGVVAPTGPETVLVVEDEDMVRDLVCEILRRHGYKVLEARGGEEALLVSDLHHEPIHLLLTDMVMPRMRGNELAERLGPLRPGMKILYMSGYTADVSFQNWNGVKEAAFIQKPFGPAALAAKVREILDSGK